MSQQALVAISSKARREQFVRTLQAAGWIVAVVDPLMALINRRVVLAAAGKQQFDLFVIDGRCTKNQPDRLDIIEAYSKVQPLSRVVAVSGFPKSRQLCLNYPGLIHLVLSPDEFIKKYSVINIDEATDQIAAVAGIGGWHWNS